MIYKSYLFKTTLVNWLQIMIVLIVLIWFSRVVAYIGLVTNNGVAIGDFLNLFILILPWMLIYLIPISFLVALILSFNKLMRASEITILKTCGLNNFQIAKPLITMSFILIMINYILSFYLMPLSNKKLRILRNNFQENYSNISFTPMTFENINQIVIYSKKRDENNNLYGILINDGRSKKYSITITAENGNLEVKEGNVGLNLTNGTFQRLRYDAMDSEILKFDNYNFSLNNKSYDTSSIKWKPNERFIDELIFPEDDIASSDYVKIQAEIHKRINDPLISAIFALIISSIMLKANNSRTGNVYNLLFSAIISIIYITLLIFSYRISDKSIYLFYLPYVINLSFFSIAFLMLFVHNKKITW